MRYARGVEISLTDASNSWAKSATAIQEVQIQR